MCPATTPLSIASGPTVPDPSTFADARAILARYGIEPPPAVKARLDQDRDETPKPGDARLAEAETIVIAKPQASLEAAAEVARAAGVAPLILGDALEGEAREVGRVMAGIAFQVRQHGQPLPPPCVLLSGGETTVTVRGKGGRGGRNTEFLLGLAIQLRGLEGVSAIAGDTDGIDGSEDNAGALVTPDTLERARAKGLSPVDLLAGNDAWALFAGLDDLVVTGPTLTNVNDFRAVLVTGQPNQVRSDAMGRLTTHVLDTANGRPAAGVRVTLRALDRAGRRAGRSPRRRPTPTAAPTRRFWLAMTFSPGRYELVFHVGAYFAAAGAAQDDPPFLDEVPIRFGIADRNGHYHVPLLVSPWSYGTYRGS